MLDPRAALNPPDLRCHEPRQPFWMKLALALIAVAMVLAMNAIGGRW